MRSDTLQALAACLDPGQLLCDADSMAPYLREIGGRERGAALAVARPSSTEQVVAVVKLCAAGGIAVIPQGGNTGLTGASLPRHGEDHLLVSLSRMKAIREFDPVGAVLIADAGCVLASLQEHIAASGFVLPLGLGSEGSCTIGGMASTNAGGIRALRYGNTRENILGLEVVLPNGVVFDGLRTLRKHNMGYDLKQLFIGAEGTLGVVTAVAVRLAPMWQRIATALVALPDFESSLSLLHLLRVRCGDAIVAFEVIDRASMRLATSAAPEVPPPYASEYAAYALIEVTSPESADTENAMLETALASALEHGTAVDAVVAINGSQRAQFWRLREAIIDGQRKAGASVKLDISVPIGAIGEFVERASAASLAVSTDSRPIAFGHVGDGNIHYSVLQPEGSLASAFMEKSADLTRAVHDIALALGGSISAEHGIGRYKRQEFERVVDPVELDLMQRIKSVLDPAGLMNPGAILREHERAATTSSMAGQ